MKKRKVKKQSGHKVVLSFFLIWPIVAVLLSFTFPVNAFYSSIIFFGIPSLLLSFLRPERIKKTFIVSLFMVPLMAVVDYVAEKTQTWLWPLPDSIIPFRFFDVVSIEVLFWIFFHVYVVVMYYQYFYEKNYLEQFWDKRAKEAFVSTSAIFTLFVLTFMSFPKLLEIPYWYFIFGMIGILPVVLLEELRYPLVFPKLLKTAIYFFYLNFTYEITALRVGWWSFPSREFVGHVSFLGVTFPFEEFFFWIILFTLAILSYYEYFFNREK